ncbi:MAG: hypothetical protein JST70_18620 [Bacteroidetes bacterium]|nr:hypothetical protein [Bacteroidota bacterium]
MNKLKALSLVLLLLCCVGKLRAEDVLYSPNEKFDLRNGSYSVIGKVNGQVYTYRGSPDGYYLDAYDDQMMKKATVVLDFIYGKVVDTRFITYDDKIMFLYQTIEGAKVIQNAVLLDDKGRIRKRPIIIGETKLGLFGSTKASFDIAVSEDKNKIAVYALSDHGRTVEASITWLTDTMTVLARGRASYDADNEISEGEAMIDNNGKLYLPVYTPIGNRNFADRVWILTIQPSEHRFQAHEMPLRTMYASGIFAKLDNSNFTISAAGFYSDKKNGSYEGVLYAKYDIVADSFVSSKLLPFDEDLRNATGERNKKNAFNDFQVRQIIVKEDGGFVLVTEDYYVSTRSAYAPGFGYYSFYYPSMSSSVREYHYNDILVLSYDAEGRGQWRSFVRKEQYSQEDGGLFSSYALVNTGGALGFMYNDFNSIHSRIQLAGVADDGHVDVHTLQSHSDDADWLPRSAKQVGSREIIVPCLRKRQICFAKVVF